MMKRILIVMAMALFAIQFIGAQASGLYLSANDFLNHKLSHNAKGEKIKLHLVFKKEQVEVKRFDTTFTYNKKQLFGYQDKEGAHRFYNNGVYDIVNPRENILIYKTTTGSGMKDSPVVDHYFFSKTAADSICPLTIANVLKSFAGDAVFCKTLETQFRYDDELLDYDRVHHQFRINRLKALTSHEQ